MLKIVQQLILIDQQNIENKRVTVRSTEINYFIFINLETESETHQNSTAG